MPLMEIRRNPGIISDSVVLALEDTVCAVAAHKLMCKEGGLLKPKDIIVEVTDIGSLDRNTKDLNIRVIAQAYSDRLNRRDSIRSAIAQETLKHVPKDATWYVWLFLVETSYESETGE